MEEPERLEGEVIEAQEFCVVEPLYKARPHTEGDDRFIFCEPSSGKWDIQNERPLPAALMKAAPDFLRWGYLDIGHFSMPAVARKLKIEHPELYRIGRPVDCKEGPDGLPVIKGQIYRGEGRLAEKANLFWEGLTTVMPPHHYYPSIGGTTIKKACSIRGCVLTEIKWRNIGFWDEPVDQAVKAVSVMPLEVFAKALIAGYGSDSAGLEGGGALRRESLHPNHPVNAGPGDDRYYRAAIGYVRGDDCPHQSEDPTAEQIEAHFRECGGMSPEAARAACAQFRREISAALSKATTTEHAAQAA